MLQAKTLYILAVANGATAKQPENGLYAFLCAYPLSHVSCAFFYLISLSPERFLRKS